MWPNDLAPFLSARKCKLPGEDGAWTGLSGPVGALNFRELGHRNDRNVTVGAGCPIFRRMKGRVSPGKNGWNMVKPEWWHTKIIPPTERMLRTMERTGFRTSWCNFWPPFHGPIWSPPLLSFSLFRTWASRLSLVQMKIARFRTFKSLEK